MVDRSRRALLGAVASAGTASLAGCFVNCNAPPAYRRLNLSAKGEPRETDDGWLLNLGVELTMSRVDDRPYEDVTLLVYDADRREVARRSVGPISESNGFDREGDDGSGIGGIGGCNFGRYEYRRELPILTDAEPGYVNARVPQDACLRDAVEDVVSPVVLVSDWDPELRCPRRMPFTVVDVAGAPDHDHRDWPTMGFDAGRTMHNPAGSGPVPQTEVWRLPVGNEAPTPVVQHGALYLALGDYFNSGIDRRLEGETVAAFDLDSGELAWTNDADHLESTFPPTVGNVVALAAGDDVSGLDPATGHERWSYPLDIDAVAPPTLHGDQLFVADRGGMLTRLDPSTGELAWERAIGVPDGSPVTDGERLYVEVDGRFQALAPDSGEPRWERALSVRGTPRVREGVVYLEVEDDLVALDAADGAERWRSGRWSRESRFAVGDDRVYGTDEEALVAGNGEREHWRRELDHTPTVVGLVGERLYATYLRTIGVFDPASGEQVGAYSTENNIRNAVVAGRHVLVTTLGGDLLVLGPGDGA